MHQQFLHRAVLACFAPLAFAGAVHAAPLDDLRAEIAAQKARLEKLEEMLQATAATTSAATKKAEEATKKADEASKSAQSAAQAASTSAKSTGLSMPAGLSIYGIIDAGVEYGNYGQGSRARIQSGLGSASRLGFKGERDFGDDLSAYFQLEAGVSIDNGQNTGHSSNVSNPGQGSASSASVNSTGVAIFSRNTFLGLNSRRHPLRSRLRADLLDHQRVRSVYHRRRHRLPPLVLGGGQPFRQRRVLCHAEICGIPRQDRLLGGHGKQQQGRCRRHRRRPRQ